MDIESDRFFGKGEVLAPQFGVLASESTNQSLTPLPLLPLPMVPPLATNPFARPPFAAAADDSTLVGLSSQSAPRPDSETERKGDSWSMRLWSGVAPWLLIATRSPMGLSHGVFGGARGIDEPFE